MSGRGLGHTGGTIDKLSGIAGIRTQLNPAAVRMILRQAGFCIFEQTERLAPADRKLYALRDLSGAVESLPLIVSSILSKKWAEGLDGLVLDVKFGGGSFMGPRPRAAELAKALLKVAKALGLKATAVLSAMDQPLGQMVGNNLEILECIETLRGHGPEDLNELTYALSREMLALAFPKRGRFSRKEFQERFASGDLAGRFFHGLEFQGADWNHPRTLRMNSRAEILRAARSGYLQAVEAKAIGEACMALGAGRRAIGGAIDPSVGLALEKKVGDRVRRGEKLGEVFFSAKGPRAPVLRKLQAAFSIGPRAPRRLPVVSSIWKNH
jgi:pyrimidine-nucleoside phosphorylase/thymidine phosphorylase